MRQSSARTQLDTAEEILDLAQELIQTRGYNAFSYQDIADVLHIRKASIHYHFPSKTDLGIAVIDRYATQFNSALDAIAADPKRKSIEMLDQYVAPYLEFARTPDKVCLCGALAGEILALAPELRARVDRFFKQHQAWLTRILKRGADRGEFSLLDKPAKVARMFFGALQGALLVKRTTGDASQLKDVIAVLKSQLQGARAATSHR
jgi:TetR/AcrR family transcriptional repressor of nem operon